MHFFEALSTLIYIQISNIVIAKREKKINHLTVVSSDCIF